MDENTPQNLEENTGFNAAPTQQTPRLNVEPTRPEPQPDAAHRAYNEQFAADPSTTASRPPVSAAPIKTETIKHTVVKTKSKKIPLFVSSLAGVVVGAILVVALVMSGAFAVNGSDSVKTVGKAGGQQTIKINAEDTTLSETVSAKCLPSVVSITVAGSSSNSSLMDSMSGNNGNSGSNSGSDNSSGSIGSGVVLDTDGNVLTNYHVIEGGGDISVSMNGKSYEAEVVGTDASSDLAVIKLKDVDKSDLTPIEIGDSSKINVGEWVMAIGSPFGNEQSVSTGIVSSLYRSTALTSASGTSIYANMIQTDAAINPGNSGGALVNDKGELIGINSIIESYSGSSSGVGFAIPVNYAVKIAKQIIAGNTPVHPYLGVRLATVNAANAARNNLSVTSGAYIGKVIKDSPAEKAGLKQGDVVTKVNDTEVTSAASLIIALRSYDVGDKVTLTVQRGKSEEKVEVKLGSDEKLQQEQQDESGNNDQSNGLTQDQLRQYLEELLGGGQQGQGQDQSQGLNGGM